MTVKTNSEYVEEIQRLSTQLEEELARTQAMLMALPDALFELDPDGRYLFFHAETGAIYTEPSNILGNTVHDLLPKDVADLSLNAIRRALETGVAQVIRYSLPGPNQEVRYFQASVGPSPSNKTVVALVRDVTDETAHRQELENQKKHLETANEALEQFVYIASHDLREPLIGVAGYATLIQKRYRDQLDEQGQHFLDEVVQGCKNMEAKIDDLLALSRAGRALRLAPFPLGAAVEEAQRSLAASIQRTKAKILWPDDLPVVKGDRSYIAQVLQNLFSNSIKYRKKDCPPVIEVSATQDPGDYSKWIIQVKDNGIGFDMRHADRIFGVFQRLYTVDQYPGTGIGLAIVKKIIDKHGGRIWALSEPQKGAIFFFTLSAGES